MLIDHKEAHFNLRCEENVYIELLVEVQPRDVIWVDSDKVRSRLCDWECATETRLELSPTRPDT